MGCVEPSYSALTQQESHRERDVLLAARSYLSKGPEGSRSVPNRAKQVGLRPAG